MADGVYIYIASVEKAMDTQSCPDDYSYRKCRAILSNTMRNMTIQGQSYNLLVELYCQTYPNTPFYSYRLQLLYACALLSIGE